MIDIIEIRYNSGISIKYNSYHKYYGIYKKKFLFINILINKYTTLTDAIAFVAFSNESDDRSKFDKEMDKLEDSIRKTTLR